MEVSILSDNVQPGLPKIPSKLVHSENFCVEQACDTKPIDVEGQAHMSGLTRHSIRSSMPNSYVSFYLYVIVQEIRD